MASQEVLQLRGETAHLVLFTEDETTAPLSLKNSGMLFVTVAARGPTAP